MNLPLVLCRAAFAQSTPTLILWTLTIRHARFETRRVVNDMVSLDVGGTVYRAFPFGAVLPAQDEEGPGVIRISMANVPSVADGTEAPVELVRLAAGADDAPRADLVAVMHDDPTVAIEAYTFTDYAIRNDQYNADALTFDMQIPNLQTVIFSAGVCTPGTTPGIF